MINPFNVTQRYFVFFQKEIKKIYSNNSIKVEGSELGG